jgi:hypothetical protein
MAQGRSAAPATIKRLSEDLNSLLPDPDARACPDNKGFGTY